MRQGWAVAQEASLGKEQTRVKAEDLRHIMVGLSASAKLRPREQLPPLSEPVGLGFRSLPSETF